MTARLINALMTRFHRWLDNMIEDERNARSITAGHRENDQ